MTAKSPPSNAESYLAIARSSDSTSVFSSQSKLLLGKLMPVLQEADPRLASKVQKEQSLSPDHKPLSSEADISEVVVRGSADSASVSRLQHQMLERQRLDSVRSLSASDPEKAVQISETLTDPGLQSSAWSVIGSAEADQHPERAREFFR